MSHNPNTLAMTVLAFLKDMHRLVREREKRLTCVNKTMSSVSEVVCLIPRKDEPNRTRPTMKIRRDGKIIKQRKNEEEQREML